MTIREFKVLVDQQSKRINDELYRADYRSAQICSILANANRDTKKRKKPFKPEDFMPQKEKIKQNPQQMFNALKAITLMYGGVVNCPNM